MAFCLIKNYNITATSPGGGGGGLRVKNVTMKSCPAIVGCCHGTVYCCCNALGINSVPWLEKPTVMWLFGTWKGYVKYIISKKVGTLQWRHNGHGSVPNHQLHDCLLNRLFRRRLTKTSNSALLAFVRGIHRRPVNSPHKWPVTRKMFPFDDVIMEILCDPCACLFFHIKTYLPLLYAI